MTTRGFSLIRLKCLAFLRKQNYQREPDKLRCTRLQERLKSTFPRHMLQRTMKHSRRSATQSAKIIPGVAAVVFKIKSKKPWKTLGIVDKL